MKNTPTNMGFTPIAAPMSREAAHNYAAANGLKCPKGAGRYILTRCDATGIKRLHLVSAFNAGRVTHKACCDPSPAAETPRKPAKTTADVVRLRYQKSNTTPIKELAVFRGFRNDLMTQFPSDPKGRHILTVTSGGISKDLELPFEGILWVQWWERLQADPLNPSPYPSVQGKSLKEKLDEAQEAIRAFLGSTAAVTGHMPAIAAEFEAALKAPEISPRLSPTLMFGRVPYSADWSCNPPKRLTPEQTAALAWMLLEWSATNTAGKPYKAAILQRWAMAKPDDLRITPREWFRHIPAPEDFNVHPWPEAERQPTTDPLDGAAVTVSIDDDDAVELIARPPQRLTLPRNYTAQLIHWDWSDTVTVEPVWPDNFLNLPPNVI